jgi:CheY-like chemotaxis protein
MRVLVCDDDRTTRLLVASLVMRRFEWSVVEVVDGADALEKLGREDLDLAILDIGMPKLDGDQRRASDPQLAEAPRPSSRHAHRRSREHVVRNLMALGISGYLVKPLAMSIATAKLEEIERALRANHTP